MLKKAMKRILNLHMATITLLAGVLMAFAADKPRTLKSVDKPLDEIQGPVSGARKLSAAELAAALLGYPRCDGGCSQPPRLRAEDRPTQLIK